MTGRDVVLGVVLVFAILAVFGLAFVPWGYYWGMGRTFVRMPMMGYGSIFFGILVFVVLVFGVYYAIRGPQTTQPTQPSSHALDIIKERYAKGEITKEQYEQLKKDLQ